MFLGTSDTLSAISVKDAFSARNWCRCGELTLTVGSRDLKADG